MQRPEFFRFHNGEKAILPFSQAEYDARLMGLRAIMDAQGLDAVVLSSMHNIAYYSGFLYCAFGRPYALVVTASEAVLILQRRFFAAPRAGCWKALRLAKHMAVTAVF